MEQTKSIEKINLPDGKYKGLQTSYFITIKISENESLDVKMNNGIRGRNFPVNCEVIDGYLYEID